MARLILKQLLIVMSCPILINGALARHSLANSAGNKVVSESGDSRFASMRGMMLAAADQPAARIALLVSPHIHLDAASLTFAAFQNGSAGTRSFTISNTGDGTLDWSIVDDADWLDETPSSGSGNSQTITVSINNTGQTYGIYYGHIAVVSGNADNSPQFVNVTLTVTPWPNLVVNPNSLSLEAVQNGSLPPSRTFNISNSGGGTLAWSVSTHGAATWIETKPLHGQVNSQDDTVSVNTTDLPVGTHNVTLWISSGNAPNQPLTVDVAYIILPCCIGTAGNVTGTGIVDSADLAALVSYLTGGGYVLPCHDAANVNGTGIVDSADLAALVSYLTGGGYVLPNCL
jgi:hypothetical protein